MEAYQLNPVQFILVLSIIIFICIIANRISRKIGVPTLLLFILLGIALGSDGIFKIPFDDYVLAERVCSFALIFIIFYGGFGTCWRVAKPVAVKAMLLSSFGTVITAVLTAVFCYLVLKMSILEGLLLGSVLGSTDAASVFFILRSKKLNLKEGSASLLEMESGSNDPFAYMMTVIILTAMDGSLNVRSISSLLVSQILIGVASGGLIGVIAARIIRRKHTWDDGFDTIFVFGIALLSYALPSVIGGNGYLSGYISGLIIGNQELSNQKDLVNFFDALTGLMQMVLFLLLGLLSFPTQMKSIIVPAILVSLFLTFIARPAAVALFLAPFKVTFGQYTVVSWAGLRGAASIVFAIMAFNHNTSLNYDIFHIVFGVVLFSILFQGSLLSVIAQLCNMIDADTDVMRTFSDYTNERQMQFVQVSIDKMHPWVNHLISEIDLLPNMLIAVLLRNGKTVVPHGQTMLLPGDNAFLCAEGISNIPDIILKEFPITSDHRWCGKKLSQAHISDDMIIVMVKRNGAVLIPDGSTRFFENDLVVIYEKPITP